MRTAWPPAVTPHQRLATEELLRRLHSRYPGRILATVLFGSLARGDSTPDSDIDLLIIADATDAAFKWDVWGIGARVSLDFDVIFNLHVYPRAVWDQLHAQRKAIWRNVEQEGIELPLQPSPT